MRSLGWRSIKSTDVPWTRGSCVVCKQSRWAFGIIAGCILVIQSACLRFVPARLVGGVDVGGETEFFARERAEQDKLASLLAERAYLLNPAAVAAYRVSPGDTVDLRVFGVSELTVAARIRPDGMFTAPLVGDIAAAGRTETELQRDITERLRRFVVSPSVTLAVNAYEGSRVSVIGEVAKPGVYPLRQGTTSLVQILSEAGGGTAHAAGHVLLLPAQAVGSPSETENGSVSVINRPSIEIEVDELLGSGGGGGAIQVPLVAGDTIVVPDAGTVEVDGEVSKPGSYPLSSKQSMVSAIAAAGGFTYSADVEQVEVIREVGNGRKAVLARNLEDVALRSTRDIRLRNGDVVRVPSARGRFMTRQIVEVVNQALRINVTR